MAEEIMPGFAWTTLATVAALVLYFVMSLRVGAARSRFKIEAPAMTGHPDFERAVRVHLNTLEWLPVFLAGVWLTAFAWGDVIAAAIGAVWVVGRLLYMLGYSAAANRRSMGFLVQWLAAMALLIAAAAGAVRDLMG
jgi:uncharacterized membrane protein YecN with MAPEG domain